MSDDYVRIRSGTNPTYAFRKIMKVIWVFILYYSRNLKTEGTIVIEMRNEHRG